MFSFPQIFRNLFRKTLFRTAPPTLGGGAEGEFCGIRILDAGKNNTIGAKR
jgi:hypothetical protein